MKFIDLTGMKFGQLTAIRRAQSKGRRSYWVWKCDCGNEAVISSEHVKSGHTISCGCAWAKKCVKHGHGHDSNGNQTRTYKAWVNMRSRVSPKIERYRKNYFDRGIIVCARWQEDFRNFLEDMGECPPGRSLDRIENDGNYEPANCRWATLAEQNFNKRNTKRVTVNGETIYFLDACQRYGIHPATAQSRLNIDWDADKVFLTPARKRAPSRPPLGALVLNFGSEWMMY